MKLLIGDVQSRLQVTPALIHSLRDYLSVDVPGAYFARRPGWNGKKYYLTQKGLFLTGLLPVVLRWFEEESPHVDLEIEDMRSEPVKFVGNVTKIAGRSMTGLYEHQWEAVEALDNYLEYRGKRIYFPRGIMDAATNAGKTTIAAGVHINFGQEKTLVLIHNKTVFRQLYDELTTLLVNVGRINDKHVETHPPVVVAMIQTLYRRIESEDIQSFLSGVRILIVDEAHRMGAATYAEVMKYSNAYIRVGITGTAMDSSNPVNKLNAIGLTGKVLKRISKREMMDKGISAEVEVNVHLCNTLLHKPLFDYKEVVQSLIFQSRERAAIIWQYSKDQTMPVLVAVDKIEHGENLYELLLMLSAGSGKSIQLTHGKDTAQVEKVTSFQEGSIDILISTEILREGVNLPLVGMTWLASGGKSAIRVKQWMGRSERKYDGKTSVTFHDFYDIGKYVQKHSEERIKVYKREGLRLIEHYDPKTVKKIKQSYIWK